MTFPKDRKNEERCDAAFQTSKNAKPKNVQIELSEQAARLMAGGADPNGFSTNSERRLTARVVRQLCGNTSDMWLWRRLHDDSGFPKPIVICRRRFWRAADVIAWLDAQPTTDK